MLIKNERKFNIVFKIFSIYDRTMKKFFIEEINLILYNYFLTFYN